jgi:hypothetical protein
MKELIWLVWQRGPTPAATAVTSARDRLGRGASRSTRPDADTCWRMCSTEPSNHIRSNTKRGNEHNLPRPT